MYDGSSSTMSNFCTMVASAMWASCQANGRPFGWDAGLGAFMGMGEEIAYDAGAHAVAEWLPGVLLM